MQEYDRDSDGNIVGAGEANPLILIESEFRGCFGGGPGSLRIGSDQLNVNTSDMFPNKLYIITLKSTTALNETIEHDAALFVVPPAAPDMSIGYIIFCTFLYTLVMLSQCCH